MTKETQKRLTKALSQWFVTCVMIGGFMFYHPMIPIGPALLAAVATGMLTAWRALREEGRN